MKVELTIGKKFTLNTQNFSSVSPSLIIKIDDFGKIDDIIKAHGLLDTVADGLFHKQIESDAKTMAIIKKLGFSKYFNNVDEDDMTYEIKKAVQKLAEIKEKF